MINIKDGQILLYCKGDNEWIAEYISINDEEFKLYKHGKTMLDAINNLTRVIFETNYEETEKTKNVGEITVDIKINVDDSDIDKAIKKVEELTELVDKVDEKINVIPYPTYHPPYKYYIPPCKYYITDKTYRTYDTNQTGEPYYK